MAQSELTPPPPIDYAPSARGRGWWKKYLIIVVLFALGLGGAYKWSSIERLYATTQAWLWQRRAMSHTLPPGTVVYSEDPNEIARLLTDRRYYRAVKNGPAVYEPAALREMISWRSRETGESWSMSDAAGGLFLHWRTVPGGKKCLVEIQATPFCPRGLNDAHYVSISGHVLIPGGPDHFWDADWSYWGIDNVVFNLKPTDQLIIFAGQSDPRDPSHFMINFSLNKQLGRIDGRVQSDGSVKLEISGAETTAKENIVIYPHLGRQRSAATRSSH